MENKPPDSRSVLSVHLSETNVFGSLRNHPVVLARFILSAENHSQTEQIQSNYLENATQTRCVVSLSD